MAALTAADDFARQRARATGLLLLIESIFPNAASPTFQAYQARFGLPPDVGRGFLNRLTGTTEPTLNEALAAELSIMSDRFELIARLFTGAIRYQCVSGPTPGTPFAIPNCNGPAWSAHTLSDYIALCPSFWAPNATAAQRALILIHEATHMIWGIGHGAAQGPGRSFRNARCYTQFVADLHALPLPALPGGAAPPACVAPP